MLLGSKAEVGLDSNESAFRRHRPSRKRGDRFRSVSKVGLGSQGTEHRAGQNASCALVRTLHFTGYQPQETTTEEFCEDIPKTGKTVVALDYVDPSMRNVPVEVKILRVVDKGDYTVAPLEEIFCKTEACEVTKSHKQADLRMLSCKNLQIIAGTVSRSPTFA